MALIHLFEDPEPTEWGLPVYEGQDPGFRPDRRTYAIREFWAEQLRSVKGVPGRGSSAPTNEKPITPESFDPPLIKTQEVRVSEPEKPPKPRTLTPLQRRREAWEALRERREWGG